MIRFVQKLKVQLETPNLRLRAAGEQSDNILLLCVNYGFKTELSITIQI